MDRYREATSEVRIALKLKPVRYDLATPPGNRGETRIITRDTPATVIQRSHRDRYEVDKKDLSSRNMRFFSENNAPVSRTVIPDRAGVVEDIEDLRQALLRFAAGLADRMSPDRLGLAGLPSPDDLVEIMREAANPESGIRVEQPEDGFRM
ncbi:hypothetical protein [Defluviimonas salinarum]|uniref:Uncharacterized protein n=1 Tax=Defluviimonas salinarum TaxID=2992147 RepID=A0ABT3J7D8_9RHOB|nr:hypothetical protein [Defluviimonas salinarum]MCW3783601.1 hypothetical protein [Defluviimonas salinarum]